jgi:glycosyltransferase involved in cell wall biosynthesis
VSQVLATGKPFVTTLHWNVTLPWIPALTICTSKTAYEMQSYRSQCVVIRNGVDLSPFGLHAPRGGERVIITRVCRPSRCALYFWEAMRQVLDRYPQVELWLVGIPGEHHWHSERVRFLGVRRDIPQILAQSDIFVYTPDPHSGSTDLTPMEAAAAGVPCVLSDVNCVQGSVVDGETGFLTPFGDVRAVVERVSRLVEEDGLRARMGRAAVKLARERFNLVDVVRHYDIVYRTVLQAGLNPAASPVQ